MTSMFRCLLVKHRYTADRVYLVDTLLYHNSEILWAANAPNYLAYKIVAHNIHLHLYIARNVCLTNMMGHDADCNNEGNKNNSINTLQDKFNYFSIEFIRIYLVHI